MACIIMQETLAMVVVRGQFVWQSGSLAVWPSGRELLIITRMW